MFKKLSLIATIACFAMVSSCSGTDNSDADWENVISNEGMTGFMVHKRTKWTNNAEVALNKDNPKALQIVAEGAGVIYNGGKTRNLITEKQYGDVELELEFMVSQGSNSGVYLMGKYEIQILDSFGKETVAHSDCGGIYQRWDPKRKVKGYEGRPPLKNASKAPGEWQHYRIVFLAPRFDETGKKTANAKFVKVIHNGVLVQEKRRGHRHHPCRYAWGGRPPRPLDASRGSWPCRLPQHQNSPTF